MDNKIKLTMRKEKSRIDNAIKNQQFKDDLQKMNSQAQLHKEKELSLKRKLA